MPNDKKKFFIRNVAVFLSSNLYNKIIEINNILFCLKNLIIENINNLYFIVHNSKKFEDFKYD